MKTAILYANGGFIDKRIKTFTLHEQIQALESFCHENNIRILEIYTDVTQTSVSEQAELQQLLRYLLSKRKKPDYVLIKYWRCLTKNSQELVQLVDALHYKDIDLRAIYDFEEVWFESMFYKYKTVDAEEVKTLKARGIKCITAFKKDEISIFNR